MRILDITLGNYYPSDSVIHSLDPRLKLLALTLLMGATFLLRGPWTVLLHTSVLLAVVRLSGIPLGYFIRALRFFLWLFIFTGILHLFFTPGQPLTEQPILGIFNITHEGVSRGALISWRLLLVIALSALLTHSTTPLEITRGMESLLSPLERLRFPVQDFSLMMMMAIRFIPVLSDEAQRVWKAQRSRGARFGRGGLKQRANALMSILIPVFAGVFRRADELATALEARGYSSDRRRTSMVQLRWKAGETLALIFVILWILLVLYLTWV